MSTISSAGRAPLASTIMAFDQHGDDALLHPYLKFYPHLPSAHSIGGLGHICNRSQLPLILIFMSVAPFAHNHKLTPPCAKAGIFLGYPSFWPVVSHIWVLFKTLIFFIYRSIIAALIGQARFEASVNDLWRDIKLTWLWRIEQLFHMASLSARGQ
jgi:hypothetical protein